MAGRREMRELRVVGRAKVRIGGVVRVVGLVQLKTVKTVLMVWMRMTEMLGGVEIVRMR